MHCTCICYMLHVYNRKTHALYLYRPIPDIVVAPVTRHLVSLVGMLVGKKVKMATATNGGLNLPAANTATDSLESDNHSTSGLREAISSPCDVSVYGKCFQMHA